MTGMSGWITACLLPCTVTAKEPTVSESPAATAVNWSWCAASMPLSAAGAYTRRSGRAASASLTAASLTWSRCSWVIRIASAPAMISAAPEENEPGSMTIDAPSFSRTTHACSCLVSFMYLLLTERLPPPSGGTRLSPGNHHSTPATGAGPGREDGDYPRPACLGGGGRSPREPPPRGALPAAGRGRPGGCDQKPFGMIGSCDCERRGGHLVRQRARQQRRVTARPAGPGARLARSRWVRGRRGPGRRDRAVHPGAARPRGAGGGRGAGRQDARGARAALART